MKELKITGMILLMLMTVTLSFAQKGQNKGAQILESELSLSDEQSLELQKARTAAKAKTKVIRADEKMTREEKRDAMKEVRTDQKAEIDEILTDDQKAKMKALKKEKQAEHKEKREAQQIELKKIRTDFDSKISAEDKTELARLKEIFKNEKGNGKKEVDDRKAFREAHKADFEKLKEISEKYKPEIQALMKEKGSERKLEKKEGKNESRVKAKGEKGKKGMKGKNRKKGSRTSAFLLMDF